MFLATFRRILAALLLGSGLTVSLAEILERSFGLSLLPVQALSLLLFRAPPAPIRSEALRSPLGVPFDLLILALFLVAAILLLIEGIPAWRRSGKADAPARFLSPWWLLLLSVLLLATVGLAWTLTRALPSFLVLQAIFTLAAAGFLIPDAARKPLPETKRLLVLLAFVSPALLLAVGWDSSRRLAAAERVDGDPLSAWKAWSERKAVEIPLPEGTLELGTAPGDGTPVLHVVEMADLECLPCLTGLSHLLPLPEDLRGRVRVSLVHFPLGSACQPLLAEDVHPRACALALRALDLPASEAKALVERRIRFPFENPAPLASPARMIEAGRARAILSNHLEIGRRLGVRATPAIWVNGKSLEAFRDDGSFHAFLRVALRKLETNRPGVRAFDAGGRNSVPWIDDGSGAARTILVWDSFECVHSRNLEADLVKWARREGWSLVHKPVPLRNGTNYEFTARVAIALAQAAERDEAGRTDWREVQRSLRALWYRKSDADLPSLQRDTEGTLREKGVDPAGIRALFGGEENKRRWTAHQNDLRVHPVAGTPVVAIRGKTLVGPDLARIEAALREE